MILRWTEVAARLAAEPAGTLLRVVRHRAENPRDAGLVQALAAPVGQRADYRLGMLFVQDFGSYYDAFLAPRPRGMNIHSATAEDALPPGLALGALLGLALSRTREGALLGGLIAVCTSRARRS
jgi:hypothetical protein